jgi:predicted transporter
MVKIALVISTLVLSMFAIALANAYHYTAVITDSIDDRIRASLWNFVGIQFIIASVVLVLVFVIRDRRR